MAEAPGWGELRLGIAVTLLVAIAVTVVLLLGVQRGPFLPDTHPYFVELDDAAGIRVGSFVRVGGVPAGEVVDVTIVPPRTPAAPLAGDSLPPAMPFEEPPNIRLELQIQEPLVPYLTASSRAQLANLGLGGERYVQISAGDVREAPLERGELIETVPSVDWDLVLAKVARSYNEVQIVAATAEAIRAKFDAGAGSAGRLLEPDAELYPTLRLVTARADSILTLVEEGPGLVGRVRADPALEEGLARLEAEIAALDSLVDDPRSGLARWRNPDELLTAVESLGRETADLKARIDTGRGTLGRLVNDRELGRQIGVLRDRVAALAAAFRADPLGFVRIRIF